jgi:hypothetical protein
MKIDSEPQQQLIEEIKQKQRSTVWPDALVNSRGVDEFLWKGSPDAPLVQRVAAWLFGIVFILAGVGWLAGAYQKHWWGICLLSIVWFYVGARVFLNGFRKRRTKKSNLK